MRSTPCVLLLVLAGCPDRPVGSVYPVQGKVETKDIPANPRRDADILFVIDNSGSMSEEQASLRANFSKMMSVLETLDGGMPDVHIGVVTSDLGEHATDGTGTAAFGGCTRSPGPNIGDDGALRTVTGVTGRYIIDEDGGGGTRSKNYAGTLADAFSTLADVGVNGCGIEQHLGAMERALENPANAGFVRPDAYLAVVVIGDEDDCSLASKTIFDGTTDGTVVNFRCTRDGITCDDNPDLDIAGRRTECHPKADPLYLEPVDRYIDFLKRQKPDERDVVVAGIVGDPQPFEIASGAQPTLAPSCTYGGTQHAYPAVRTSAFFDAFQLETRTTICKSDLSDGLTQIGALLKATFGDPCFDVDLADLDPAPGLQPDCTVTDVRRIPGAPDQELAVIPSCALAPTAVPCWHIDIDNAKCAYTHTDPHYKLVVERGGVVPTPDIHIKASCVSQDNSGQVQ